MIDRDDIRRELAVLGATCPWLTRETLAAWAEQIRIASRDLELEDLTHARATVATEETMVNLSRLLGHARERATRRQAMTPRIEAPSSGIRGELAARAVLEMLARPRHERPQSEAEWERAIRARCEGGVA